MNELIKYTGSNAIVKKADNYLSYLGTLLQKRYAPDLPELIPYRRGDKWGFCNRYKKVLIECTYSHVFPFSEDIAFFRKNEKWGLVNLSGDEIELAECDSLDSGRFRNGISSITCNGKSFLIDKSGNLIIEGVRKFKEGMALSIHDDKYGFVNDVGELIVSHKYDYALDFDQGLAKIGLNGKSGFIDKNGIEVVPLQYYHYDYQTGDYENGIEEFNEGLALVWIKCDCGFIDKSGKLITELKYHFGHSFSEGRALVRLNGKYGYINQQGLEVIPLIYDLAEDFSEGLALVRLNEKKFFIDKDGNEKISLDAYHSANSFKEGLSLVGVNSKYGFIDKSGKMSILMNHIFLYFRQKDYLFENGVARAIKNEKVGFIDKEGNEIVPFIYEMQESYTEKVLHRTPYYSSTSEINPKAIYLAQPEVYRYVDDFRNGLAYVRVYQAFEKTISLIWTGYIDKLGNEYWEH